MTNIKKIIPCLDIKNGKVVKGTNFVNIKDVGDPVEIAAEYCRQGADELVFLDITATTEDRQTMFDVLARAAKSVNIPLAIGGGIRTLEDIEAAMAAGANKVGINSAALTDKTLIPRAAAKFGSGAIVSAIDAIRLADGSYSVVVRGGQDDAHIDAVEWAKEVENMGAGEILLTSRDTDGMKTGFDIPLTRDVAAAVTIPVTASGGCGSLEHFYEVFEKTGAASALAASLFHFGVLTVPQVKEYLRSKGVNVVM